MSMPLFASGTARGGTNLLVMSLSVNSEISLAQDPYLPIFKSLRNAIISSNNDKTFKGFDEGSPLDEYYYFDERLAVMRAVQDASLDIPFNEAELPGLLVSLANRMSLSSPLLSQYLNNLRGDTYKDLFLSALEIVGTARHTPNTKWLGFNDNWTVEFFPALARAFPESHFIIIIRDVRASIATQLQLKDPGLIALIMSFARCWRKQVAMACHYQSLDLFKDRLHILTYEQLVSEPENRIKELSRFLDVDYTPDMIDTTKFVGPDGGGWIPNSNFKGAPQKGIYQGSVNRWKKVLSSETVNLIEFIAGSELEMLGYELEGTVDDDNQLYSAHDLHQKNHQECKGWRTDNNNPDLDFGLELLRQKCLQTKTHNIGLIERCFLFPDVYEKLYEGKKIF